MGSKVYWQMTQCLVNICVVVYNVVVFSGEDIGGQMREMAILVSPVEVSWCPGVPKGLMTGQAATEGQLP